MYLILRDHYEFQFLKTKSPTALCFLARTSETIKVSREGHLIHLEFQQHCSSPLFEETIHTK